MADTEFKWNIKDPLKNVRDKYNNTVDSFSERISSLENTSTEINQSTQEAFNDYDNRLGAITEGLNRKIESVTKADIGLDKVDNTPDLEKPISPLQQQAIDASIDEALNEFIYVESEEVDDDELTNLDNPSVSQPIKDYINDRVQEIAAGAGVAPYSIASDNVLGVVKSSTDVVVNQTTGKMEIPLLSPIVNSLNSNNRVVQKISDTQGNIDELLTESKTIVGAINEIYTMLNNIATLSDLDLSTINFVVDSAMSDTSTNPVRNSVIKNYVDSALNSVYRPMGSVETEEELDLLDLSTLPIGAVYNIESASSYGAPGMNVAWNGTGWDNLGGDMAEINSLTNDDIDNICI